MKGSIYQEAEVLPPGMKGEEEQIPHLNPQLVLNEDIFSSSLPKFYKFTQVLLWVLSFLASYSNAGDALSIPNELNYLISIYILLHEQTDGKKIHTFTYIDKHKHRCVFIIIPMWINVFSTCTWNTWNLKSFKIVLLLLVHFCESEIIMVSGRLNVR